MLIGGGGERKTLRLVAEHADACNLFGDVATVRHKLEVLQRHCDDVGRDRAEITATKLTTLIIGADEADIERRTTALACAWKVDAPQLAAMAIVGHPEAVVAQVEEHLAAGLDGLILNMPNVQEPGLVELAGRTLTGAFGALER